MQLQSTNETRIEIVLKVKVYEYINRLIPYKIVRKRIIYHNVDICI